MTGALKTVLITGAAQGLGLTAASLLSQEYRVILVDIQSVEAQAARLRGMGREVLGMCGDVSSEAFVQEMAERIGREFGGLDGLVNNAGVSLIRPAEQTSAAQWQRVMAINLFGPFLFCRYLGAQMLVSHRSAYNASKHGLVGLTKTLAAEWGGRGVRVNAVCPAWIKTEMDAADQGAGAYSDTDIVDRVPMARFALPKDVAEAIAFLLDANRSGFINGISLPVDGGWTADASWNSLRLSTRP